MLLFLVSFISSSYEIFVAISVARIQNAMDKNTEVKKELGTVLNKCTLMLTEL